MGTALLICALLMPITDQQFQDWLFRDRQRCVLVDATAYSGGAEVSRRFSNRAYVTKPSESPANAPYDDILKGGPTFDAKLSELFVGNSIPSWGDLLVTNEGGARDSWLSDAWDGRSLKIALGDPTWARADFRTILDGVTADIGSPDRDSVALEISDKAWMLNVPAQTTLIGGATANKDQPKPICLGQCFNVEPVWDGNHYYVHEGAIEAITDVRVNGLTVGAGNWTNDLANGRYTINVGVAGGRVTCDVKGAKPAGTYVTKCADMIDYLVKNHTQLVAADIDAANFTAFNATCPQLLGRYIRERENLQDVLDDLVTSVGGFYTFSIAGLLQLGRLAAPAGASVISLTADDVRKRRIWLVRRELPVQTWRIGYQRNYTIQTSGLAAGVTEANRVLYGAPYLIAKATDPAIATTHKLARSPDVRDTCLVLQADADAEAARLLALFGVPRTTYGVAGYMAPYTLTLGQEGKLTHPRFGFAAGATGIVVGMEKNVIRNSSVLHLWR